MTTVMPQVHPASFKEEFTKGKPKTHGVVIILAAILQVVLEIVLIVIESYTLQIYISFWVPAFYIIAGSLSIAGSNKQNVGLVKAAMAFNIITSIFSGIALILSIASIAIVSFDIQRLCNLEEKYCWIDIVGLVFFAIFLFTNALLFGLSITISVFANRALHQAATQSSHQVFVIHNTTMVPEAQGAIPIYYPSYTQPPSAPPS
ncbi:membrane-spanning 4-domains subfamily A member 4A-like isoform X1 [Lithobates pipiens]